MPFYKYIRAGKKSQTLAFAAFLSRELLFEPKIDVPEESGHFVGNRSPDNF
jgi:hypothetical protein